MDIYQRMEKIHVSEYKIIVLFNWGFLSWINHFFIDLMKINIWMAWNLYIYVFFIILIETQIPSYRAFFTLHFKESYFTYTICVVCHDVREELLHVETSNRINS